MTIKNYLLSGPAIIVIMIISSTGCISQNVYGGLRFNQELEGQKMPGAEMDDSMRRSGMGYDEY
jgi:hypothetical protein